MNSMLFKTPEEHANFVANEVATLLSAAIKSRGQAVLAVSGGKSPILLFEALSIQSIAWRFVTVFLVDERWVLPDDERSNEKLVRAHLLQRNAADAKFISVREAGDTPAAAADALSVMFVDSPALAKLSNGVDVAVLGIGEDGHTASWFPRSRELQTCFSSTRAYEAVSAEEGRDARVTMTLSSVSAAHKIFICAEGETKRMVLANAQGAGSVEQYPVRAVLRLPSDSDNDNNKVAIRLT